MRKSAAKNGQRNNLESMKFEDLLIMREKIDVLINKRANAERRELERRLENLKLLSSRKSQAGGDRSVSSRKLPAKYMNPKNPEQTWAGRGLRPRWIVEAMKKGRKLEDFAVR